jgi:serine O-acetyltransferase
MQGAERTEPVLTRSGHGDFEAPVLSHKQVVIILGNRALLDMPLDHQTAVCAGHEERNAGVTNESGELFASRGLIQLDCKKLINSDLHRHLGRTDLRALLYAYLRRPGFRYMFFYRKTQHHFGKRGAVHRLAYVLYKLILEHYGFKYGFDIAVGTQIGPGLHINHFGTITINPEARLGSNINLAPGVTIGVSYGRKAGVPVVHDRVWIGANAVIVGGITIGEGAMIAPGAFVNFDVLPNSVVLGNPGKVVSQKGSALYITNTVESNGSISPRVL